MLLFLINDILDFSKIESGKMDIIPVDYDLGILLSDTIDMIHSRAEEKKLQLELKIESNTPAHLHGDEVRLRQIITNILTNAVKYTPEGKVILTVSGKKVSTEAVQLYVSVKDTGIGIKEEEIQVKEQRIIRGTYQTPWEGQKLRTPPIVMLLIPKERILFLWYMDVL